MPREGAFHHLIIVSHPRQDKRSKGNGCAIQHDFMLLTVRINETFLGFIEAANQTAKSLKSDVLNFLSTLGINLAKCRGQGYDWAANMKNILRLQDENKKQYNKHRKPAYNYKPNDTVAMQRTQFGTGLKLRPKYFGPYEVTKVNKHDRYEVQKIGQHEGPNVTSTSADKMKKWCTH
ncbi:transposon Tf2-9 polyprotein [Trichonephila clavipes]|nr:transposon Tf2-9 polyprotein [Trichonephila clavipes]